MRHSVSGRDRRAGFQVAHAVGAGVRDLAAAADDELPTGEPAVVDVAREVVVEHGQAGWVEADAVRVGGALP